ncbi:Endocytosis and vacuole integrity protein [Marasmius crinis-equi]|uniref:Endocytosis and vacuole integrity protein n=1 Tax=Marasmius crinis-equi TaxID=585013 RepID=A0ABR3EVU6_9AGAR
MKFKLACERIEKRLLELGFEPEDIRIPAIRWHPFMQEAKPLTDRALDISTQDDPQAKQLRIVRDIIESGWPALLAALSFIISTNLSDELFVDVLSSYQAMTNVSGKLGLTTPRDAFFTSLSKFAVPTQVVCSVDSYVEPQTPRTASSITENFGLGGGATQPPGLSERNLACLKVLISSAMFLAGSLGESWFGILEVLQNGDYVLTKSVGATSKALQSKRAVSGGGRPEEGVKLAGENQASIDAITDEDIALRRFWPDVKEMLDAVIKYWKERSEYITITSVKRVLGKDSPIGATYERLNFVLGEYIDRMGKLEEKK